MDMRETIGHLHTKIYRLQIANTDLLAVLEAAPAPVSNPSPTYIDRWERWFIDVRLRAIAKAKEA